MNAKRNPLPARMKTVLSNQIVDIPENVDIAQKRHTVIMKDPRGLQSHQHKKVSLERKIDSRLTSDGEIERNWLWFWPSIDMYWASFTLGFLYKLRSTYAHFPSMFLFWRMGLLFTSEIYWVKNTITMFGWHQSSVVQYLKPQKMSSFLKETHWKCVIPRCFDSAKHNS